MSCPSAVEKMLSRRLVRDIGTLFKANFSDLAVVLESGAVSTGITCQNEVQVNLSVRTDRTFAHLCVVHAAVGKRCLEVDLTAGVGLMAFSGIVKMLREEPWRYRAWADGVQRFGKRVFCWADAASQEEAA